MNLLARLKYKRAVKKLGKFLYKKNFPSLTKKDALIIASSLQKTF